MISTLAETQNMTEKTMALSVERVAVETTLSESFIRNEIRDGKLRVRRVGKRVLVLRKDLETYLEDK